MGPKIQRLFVVEWFLLKYAFVEINRKIILVFLGNCCKDKSKRQHESNVEKGNAEKE